MSIVEDTRAELAKASMDNEAKKVINKIAREIDHVREEHEEIRERIKDLEEKR